MNSHVRLHLTATCCACEMTPHLIISLQKERIQQLEGALNKAGALAEWDSWPERFPLAYGFMVNTMRENK